MIEYHRKERTLNLVNIFGNILLCSASMSLLLPEYE